ncbi:telomerase reverse transcriptase, putative [Ectocarpus siliculosus]|uniref:Telomerase reverse transcriptase n=1 Tax=Ectocarpus siliculosus TaxID=2880 RepID=D7G237_ECTSI|nr:telomerase reverse transcriptase, putative [Ectocarpus siliculosus]|eukprot:CBJ33340.1 telomerase reverse transcriptase, putative [Ectocarpus siliculosus]
MPPVQGGRCQSPGKGQSPDGRWMLKLIYPNAVNLDSYLEVWLQAVAAAAAPGSASLAAIEGCGGPASYLSRQDDGPEYKKMLKETLVAFHPSPVQAVPGEAHAPLPRHASLQHRSSMADLLDRVVQSLLRSSTVGGQGNSVGGYYAAQGDDPRRNVLSLGCRVAGPQATSELLSVQGVACTFPNTTVNVIRSPPWELLLSRIGDDLMFALLRQHAVLQRLPNRCYMQAPAAAGGEQAGPPPAASHQGTTGNRATNGKTSGSPVEAPATISRVAHDLVRDAFASSLHGEDLGRQQQPLGDAAHGKGRPGVLQRAGSGVMPKATGSPGKLALGGGGARRRLPKRLRRAVPLFEEMIGRAHRCNIGRLLEAHCPLPQSVRGTKAGKRGPGEGGQPLGPNKREGGFQAAAPPPSPSDVSTLHEEVGGQAEDVSAADLWRQEVTASEDEDSGSEGGGGDNSSSSSSNDSEDENKEPGESDEEEDVMDTGSTVKEVRTKDNDYFTVRTHGGVGGISCADGVQGEEEEGIGSVLSSDRASAERAAEPQRLLRGGCADASPWGSVSRGSHESGGGTSGSSSGGGDSGNISDATLLDEAPTANGASALAAGVQASPPLPPPDQPTFSVDPNMTFIEMATEHRRVVDFLCQACHRIFPTELWGSRRNMVCLSRGIERFVVLRRHDTMSVLEQQQQQDQEPAKTRRVNNGKRKAKGGPVGGDGNCKRPRGGADAGGAANGTDRARADSHGHHGSERIHGGGGGRGSGSVEARGSFPGTSNQGTKRADTSKKKKARGGGKGRVAVGSKGDKSIRRRRRRRTRQRLPPSDLAKRVELLEALVLWTFKDVIVPLLRSLFYVTECETASQEVFFFRKPVWAKFRLEEAFLSRDTFAGTRRRR